MDESDEARVAKLGQRTEWGTKQPLTFSCSLPVRSRDSPTVK
jgi:hypothetical protein